MIRFVLMLAVVSVLMVCKLPALTAAQFKAAQLDPSATYAIRMVEGKDGWKGREIYKLCPLNAGQGDAIKFALVAKTKACPEVKR